MTTAEDEGGRDGPVRSLRIPLIGLNCVASDRIGLEKALAQLPGVKAVYVNPATDAAHLEVDQESFDVEEAGRLLARHGVRRLIIPPFETWPTSGNGEPTSDR